MRKLFPSFQNFQALIYYKIFINLISITCSKLYTNLMTNKQPWKAAILNFFIPGSGHAYAQQWKKGIFLYILLLILVLSIRFIAYSFALMAGIFALSIGFYFFIIISGYRAIDKHRIYPKRKFDKWYFYFLSFLGIGTIFNVLIVENIIKQTPVNLL